MAKHLKILSAALLIALACGCGDNDDEILGGIAETTQLYICFIGSEGQDLLTGINPGKWKPSNAKDNTGNVLSEGSCHIKKLFINDEEIQMTSSVRPGLVHEGWYGLPYKSILFPIGIWAVINDAYNDIVYTDPVSGDPVYAVTVHTVRSEIVFPYMFGNYEVHTLTGELCVSSGKSSWFQKCWLDGVEASPVYSEYAGAKIPAAFIVRVDR
jgi:hypothetical protein